MNKDFRCTKQLLHIGDVAFTRREFDVLACILGGRSSKKIGQLLSIAPKTVETHVRNIMLKIGCNSKESVIDFMEQSEPYQRVKEHYIHLVLKPVFKKNLQQTQTCFKHEAMQVLMLQETKGDFDGQMSFCCDALLQLNVRAEAQLCAIESLPGLDLSSITHVILFSNSTDYISGLTAKLQELLISAQGGVNFKIIVVEDGMASLKNSSFKWLELRNFPNIFSLTLQLIAALKEDPELQRLVDGFQEKSAILMGHQHERQKPFAQQIMSIKLRTKLMLSGLVCGLVVSYLGFSWWYSGIFESKIMSLPPTVQQHDVIKNLHLLGLTPPKNHHFTGRYEELLDIENHFGDENVGVAFQVVSGLAGMGKTQLVTEFVYESLKKQKYDAVFWVTAENASVMNDAYRKTAEQLHLDIKGIRAADIQKLVHKTLFDYYRDKKLLIVLDNAGDYSDEMKRYRKGLISTWATTQSLHVLITSRNQSWPFKNLILDNFSHKEAREYVKKVLPHESNDAVDRLIHELHRFPLVLSAAVAYIDKHTNIDNYLVAFSENQKRFLSEFPNDHNQYHASLWSAWRLGMTQMSPEANRIAYLSAYLHPDHIPISLFNTLKLGARTDTAINDLRSHSIITLNKSRHSFRIHRLLQAVIRLDLSMRKKKF